jgi:hypothetical protein
VTSLDFDDTGELAVTCRTDDTLQFYNCKEGKWARELKSQKYGVNLAKFTHHSQAVIYASTKMDGPYPALFASMLTTQTRSATSRRTTTATSATSAGTRAA